MSLQTPCYQRGVFRLAVLASAWCLLETQSQVPDGLVHEQKWMFENNAFSWVTRFCSDHFKMIRNIIYIWCRMIAQEQKILLPYQKLSWAVEGFFKFCFSCLRQHLNPGWMLKRESFPKEEDPARTTVEGKEEECPQSGWPNWLSKDVSSHSNSSFQWLTPLGMLPEISNTHSQCSHWHPCLKAQ